jgi:DNA modification methylase
MIIWNKGQGGMGDLTGTLATDYEIILAYNRGNKLPNKRIGSVWSINKDNTNQYVHPTQKPVKLSRHAIEHLSTGSVLDPFLGSGSTLIACEQTNRICYGMELDPAYVDVIIQRWENFTGQKAQKLPLESKIEAI